MTKSGKTGSVVVLFLALLWLGVGAAGAQDAERMKPGELKQCIESGDPSILVVDVQPKSVYEKGHIKGAVSFPWQADLKNSGPLPREKTLILYCDCGQEEDSLDVATQLKYKFGYEKVKVLEGGWTAWQKLGYPVEK